MHPPDPPDDFSHTLAAMRAPLHRYCARMLGSAIDAEDVVQEALARALAARPAPGVLENPQAWLFRIAHNAALDFLRRRGRHRAAHLDEFPEDLPDPADPLEARQLAAFGLRPFMALPAAQRSAVILMDVLGHTLEEICEETQATLPAVKAALSRGRARLRKLGPHAERDTLPPLDAAEQARLAHYIERFNARDFDAVRALLADDIQLEVVGRRRLNGKAEAQHYFHNYSGLAHWALAPGLVDGRPAALVRDTREAAGGVTHFILIEWRDGRIARLRDFFHCPYVADSAGIFTLPPTGVPE